MSASHPLDGDGVNHMLFHYLSRDATTMLAKRKDEPVGAAVEAPNSKKRKEKNMEEAEFRIPDTVVYFNTPTTWYYWDETTQKCEKKDSKHLEKENLEAFFGRPVGKGCEIVCSFLSRNSGGPDSVIFMDQDELHDFLYSKPEHHGLLQRFVVPAGGFNFMYQAVWCKRGPGGISGMTKVFKRVSRQKLKDRFVPKDKLINPANEGYVAFADVSKRRAKQQREEKARMEYCKTVLTQTATALDALNRPASAPPLLPLPAAGLLPARAATTSPEPPRSASVATGGPHQEASSSVDSRRMSSQPGGRASAAACLRPPIPRGISPAELSTSPRPHFTGSPRSLPGSPQTAASPSPKTHKRLVEEAAAELEWMQNSSETKPIDREMHHAARLCKELKGQMMASDQHYDKAITFEGSAHYAEEMHCHSGINKKISKAVAHLVNHFEALDHTYNIARIVVYFKEDMRGRLWLMFTSSVRVREARGRQDAVTHRKGPSEFADVYRFQGVLTPKFKGLYCPDDDDEVDTAHKSTRTPSKGTDGSGRRQNKKSPRNGQRIECRSLASTLPPGVDTFTHSLAKMAQNNERALQDLEMSTKRVQAANGTYLDRIGVYNQENHLLRTCLRKRQLAYKELCTTLHGPQGRAASPAGSEAHLDRVQHYPLDALLQRTGLPNAAKKRMPSAVVAAACTVLAAAVHISPENATMSSVDGKKLKGAATSPYAARRKLLPGGARGSQVLPTGAEGTVDLDWMVKLVAVSHERQEERRFVAMEGKVLTKTEFWTAAHRKKRKSVMKMWRTAGDEPSAANFAARMESAVAPADALDDILYTAFNDVALARRSTAAPDHIFAKPSTEAAIRELLDTFPHDYIFDVPETVAEHLVPRFEDKMRKLKLHVFQIHEEYARVVDNQVDRLAQMSRYPGIRPADLQGQEEKIEQARANHLKLVKAKPAPYIGGMPLALIIRQGERGTMPQFNALLKAFRASLLEPLEEESRAFHAAVRAHIVLSDDIRREIEEVTYQRGGPHPPAAEGFRAP
eukprot:TRINITY_DN20169_c0_g1_i1.p1 TRINITY_DN20169_c0_g1~~TRINITY_DN20169_c0_g1_i1.p1  ORF type:complete len:1026 (+),score=362.43 TRINITY_DN20169_c0_g1_i1:91-3168(+)